MSVRLTFPLVVFCVLVSGCASDQKSTTPNQSSVFPRFDSHVVAEGAIITWKNYVASHQGKPLKPLGEITADLWAPAMRDLKPEYVYANGVNIVVVRMVHNGKERGIYVGLSIASTPGPNPEEFTKVLIAHTPHGRVYTFIRDGCLDRGLAPH